MNSSLSVFNSVHTVPVSNMPVSNMPRQDVDSSYLDSVGYDDEDGVMQVEFRDGAVYDYQVPYVSDFWDLLEADSVGQKFYYDFRTSVPYRQVAPAHKR